MSPFKSKAQRAKFAELVKAGQLEQSVFDEWDKATGKTKLPERVEKKKPEPKRSGKIRTVRNVRVLK